MKNNKKLIFVLILAFSLINFSSCYNLKESPFYESEWIMENVDKDGLPYFNHLILNADKQVTFQVYYKNSNNALVWTGKYKVDSKKIVFNFENCNRIEDGQIVSKIIKTSLIKYFEGEFLYCLAPPNAEYSMWRLDLIRPKNFFYGKNLDFMGNPMDTFHRVEK